MEIYRIELKVLAGEVSDEARHAGDDDGNAKTSVKIAFGCKCKRYSQRGSDRRGNTMDGG